MCYDAECDRREVSPGLCGVRLKNILEVDRLVMGPEGRALEDLQCLIQDCVGPQTDP